MSIQVSSINAMLLIQDNQAVLAAKLVGKAESAAAAAHLTAQVLDMCTKEQAAEFRNALAAETQS